MQDLDNNLVAIGRDTEQKIGMPSHKEIPQVVLTIQLRAVSEV